MIGGEAESVQRRIYNNDRILAFNQKLLVAAFWVAAAAPVLGTMSWLIAR